MYWINYFLFVIPAISLLLAFVAVVVRLPGEAGPTLTRRRALLAVLSLVIGAASFGFAAHVLRTV